MRLGLNCVHWDARNDLRDLTEALGSLVDVVVYSPTTLDPAPKGVEVRALEKPTVRDRLLMRVWNWAGELPRWDDQLLMALVAGNGPTSPSEIARMRAATRVRSLLPVKVGRRFLFSTLARSFCRDDLRDVDAFLFLTNVDRDLQTLKLWAAAMETGKPTALYVTSWDHSSNARLRWGGFQRYFVWARAMERDLWEDHNVYPTACRQVGASLFSLLERFLREPLSRPIQEPYVLFACALGNERLARRELELASELAEALRRRWPSWKLVVRAYPMAKLGTLLEDICSQPNVHVDARFLECHKDRRLDPEEIEEKYQWLKHCELFVHVGTTLGLECAYLDRPQVLWVDPLAEREGGLSRTALNPHIVRYLRAGAWPYEVSSAEEIEGILENLATLKETFAAHNRELARISPLRNIEAIAGDLASGMREVLEARGAVGDNSEMTGRSLGKSEWHE